MTREQEATIQELAEAKTHWINKKEKIDEKD